MNPVKKLRQIKNKLTSFREIAKLVHDPDLSKSYFPEATRKNKWSIWWDNLLWLAKNNEVNRFYYVYGLDRKSAPHDLDVLPYPEFRRLRNQRNLKPNQDGYNYVCILRDKFVFSQFLNSLGFPAPQNLALLNRDEITWFRNMQPAPLDTLVEDKQLTVNGFCKKLDGIHGKGAFALQINEGRLFIKESEITLDQLKQRLNGTYLLQDRLVQHPAMSALHANSVNSVRLTTFNNGGKVETFSAALRIGTQGRDIDNWSSGGILIGVDLQTGQLKKEGIFKPGYGGRVEKHPDTGRQLHGFQIPYFQESVNLALQLHTYLYGIHSIGWDIAITPNGPVFIEGNDDWDGYVPMLVEKNFKTRFLKMVSGANVEAPL